MAPDSTATRATVASEVLQKARILLADDQADVLQALRLLLKAEGCDIDTATSPAGVVTTSGSTPGVVKMRCVSGSRPDGE